MAKKSTVKSDEKKNYSRSDRRTHCIIDSLPAKLQLALERMIIDKVWPYDFGKHFEGFPRYVDAVRYCKQKGFIVSGSSMARFALRIQNIKGDLRPYILTCLTEACARFVELQSDRPKADKNSEQTHLLDYISKAIADLKRLK